MTDIPDKFPIPEEAYESPVKLGQFIAQMRERRKRASDMEKAIKATLDEAEGNMLDLLASSGQRHFAFEDLGTFAKSTTQYVSFPNNEDGGRQKAIDWLTRCLDAGLLDIDELMTIQQARVSKEPVLALEEAVAEYNQRNPNNPLPESPFRKGERVSLSFTKR